jgi:hypothetical protein
MSQATGRVWFEVEVVEATGMALVGFAGTNFRGGMVGYKDAMSWGIAEDGTPYHAMYAPSPPAHSIPAPNPSSFSRILLSLLISQIQIHQD